VSYKKGTQTRIKSERGKEKRGKPKGVQGDECLHSTNAIYRINTPLIEETMASLSHCRSLYFQLGWYHIIKSQDMLILDNK